MHPSRVDSVLAAKRRQHPELRGRPTWEGVMAILVRENIQLIRKPLPDKLMGLLFGYAGEWTICISSSTAFARSMYVVLHELGHLWLHQDPIGRHELCFTMGCDSTDDREVEAEDFVSMILNPECWK